MVILNDLVARARRRGLVLRTTGGRLVAYLTHLVTPELREEFSARKSEVVRFLENEVPVPDSLSPDLRDDWEERAGILQFDGGMDRVRAEREAWWITAARSPDLSGPAPAACPQCGGRSASALRGLSCPCGYIWRVRGEPSP